jgi:hypothetical protein
MTGGGCSTVVVAGAVVAISVVVSGAVVPSEVVVDEVDEVVG